MQIYDNKCFHKVKTHAVIMQLCQEYGKNESQVDR